MRPRSPPRRLSWTESRRQASIACAYHHLERRRSKLLRLLCVAGASGTGKTTLLERLLDHLPTDRGRVALLKHTHHELDWHPPGKDSTRFWQAGAGVVVVVDPVQKASFTRATDDSNRPSARGAGGDGSDSLLQTRSLLDACSALPGSIEIVLAEGWTNSLAPKVWFAGGDRETLPFDQVPEVRAIISDPEGPILNAEGLENSGAEGTPPVYTRDDVAELAARIWDWAAPLSELREVAAASASTESRLASSS
ncbi:MAG: molybdopterin-guanine dinucleotide biosynthesis protein MobB [Gemmatimonadota bacterium]